MSSETFNWAWATVGGGWGGGTVTAPPPPPPRAAPRLVAAGWRYNVHVNLGRQEVLLRGSSFVKALLETCIETNQSLEGEEEEWWSTLG